MVKLTSITTKTGDGGMTSLGNGERQPKSALRIEAYGTIDEANCAIGLARSLLEDQGLAHILAYIQNDLFDLGADLCVPEEEKTASKKTLRLSAAHTRRLETDSARLNENLPPLDSFILPAGLPYVAALHLARAITRRAERHIVALQAAAQVNPEILRYINRLSDLLFIISRHASGSREEKWIPKK